MLSKNSEQTLTYFRVTFDANVRSNNRLSDAAGVVQDCLSIKLWNPVTAGGYLLRDFDKGFAAVVQVNSVLFCSFGFDFFKNHERELSSCMRDTVQAFGVTKIERIGYQTLTWLDLGMKENELLECMYGVLLPEKERVRYFPGEIFDTAINIYGKAESKQYRLIVTPQSSVQAKATFLNQNIIEFMQKDKWDDQIIRAFLLKVEKPSLRLEIDVSEQDTSLDRIAPFVIESHALINKLGENILNELLGTVKVGAVK